MDKKEQKEVVEEVWCHLAARWSCSRSSSVEEEVKPAAGRRERRRSSV